MSSAALGTIGVGILLVLLILRIPVAFAMFLVGFVGIWILNGGASARPDVYATDEVAALPYSQASMDSNAAAIRVASSPTR